MTISRINEALLYLDKTMTKHNFKEALMEWLEDKLSQSQDKYESLLLSHTSSLAHLHMCKVQLA